MKHTTFDAQAAFSFLVQQATKIEAAVYEMQYADIQYPSLVPVDTSGPEWIKSITYFSVDMVGQASWFHAGSDDVPHVAGVRDKFETVVHMGAIGYDYNLEELGTAQMMGIPLTNDKAAMARRAAEEFIDARVLAGDATKGMLGLINQSSVTASTAPADGSSSATTWASKTPDQVLRDFNTLITGIWTGSYGIEQADTVLLPYSVLLDLSTRRIDTVNQTTLLEWIERNNIYTKVTGGTLTIKGIFGYLDAAGSGTTKRAIAYRRAPDVLKFHMPMPFRFWPVWQAGPMRFEVPGAFRLGGVDVKRPKAMRYLDGI